MDISPYIPDIPDEPATSPALLGDMVLVSKYLPWRIHISPGSVRDMVVALYTALRNEGYRGGAEGCGRDWCEDSIQEPRRGDGGGRDKEGA